MPFDFKSYTLKCKSLSNDELQLQWQKYTREIASGGTISSTSVMFVPLTAGISSIGLPISTSKMYNARKKMQIIDAEFGKRGETHVTRKRDVVSSVALAGTIGVLSLGLAPAGSDMLGAAAGEKGLEYAIAHLGIDTAGAVVEHKHDKDLQMKAENKLMKEHMRFCVCGFAINVEANFCSSCGLARAEGGSGR